MLLEGGHSLLNVSGCLTRVVAFIYTVILRRGILPQCNKRIHDGESVIVRAGYTFGTAIHNGVVASDDVHLTQTLSCPFIVAKRGESSGHFEHQVYIISIQKSCSHDQGFFPGWPQCKIVGPKLVAAPIVQG